jgi:hypothetical protein
MAEHRTDPMNYRHQAALPGLDLSRFVSNMKTTSSRLISEGLRSGAARRVPEAGLLVALVLNHYVGAAPRCRS